MLLNVYLINIGKINKRINLGKGSYDEKKGVDLGGFLKIEKLKWVGLWDCWMRFF